jgi:hypothetical protein
MRKLFFILIIFGCKKGTSSFDYSMYGIFARDVVIVAFYDTKNSQVISDAKIYLNEKNLSYYHPFYITSYQYIPNTNYTLKVYYRDIYEEIPFTTIEIPDTFIIIKPESQYINLNENLIVKWKVDSNYIKNHDFYFVVFFENKSKNPTLVYQTDFLPEETDSILIPFYYIDTPNSRYEIRIFLVNYKVLEKFKPYPGYKFSFMAYGASQFGIFFTH